MPRPRYHAAASLALAGVVVAGSRRWRDAVPILVAGVLVDLDHLVDMALVRGRGRHDLVVLPLHAWEWVGALLLRRSRTADGLASGLAAHLALDQTGNAAVRHPLFYWITLRLLHRFRADAALVYPDRFEQTGKWTRTGPLEWV